MPPPGIYFIETQEPVPRAVTCPEELGGPLRLGPLQKKRNQKWELLPNGAIFSLIRLDAFATTTNPGLVGSPVLCQPLEYPWGVNQQDFVTPIGTAPGPLPPNFWMPSDVDAPDPQPQVILQPVPFNWVFTPTDIDN